jgi:general stress protein YciG
MKASEKPDFAAHHDKKSLVSVIVGHSDGGLVVHTGERKERRGFASMSPEKQREIASKGGRAAHEKGTAHEWTADEARNAGRKGGQVSRGGRGRLVVPPTESAEAAADDSTSTAERTE